MNVNYIKYLIAMKKSPNTIKSYTMYVEQMLNYVNKPEPEIAYTDLMNWQASISHLSAGSVCLQIASVRSYFKFLRKTDIISHDPSEDIECPKKHSKEKPYMDATTIRKLINASRTVRDKAILLTFCTTGLRVGELSNITLAQFNKARINREVTITGKGDKSRTVYLNDETMEAIETYVNSRRDNCPYLFATITHNKLDAESFSKTIKATAHRAGIPFADDISNHCLRVAAATSYAEAGVPLEDIRDMLGHASISTTSRYLKSCKQRVRSAMMQTAF